MQTHLRSADIEVDSKLNLINTIARWSRAVYHPNV